MARMRSLLTIALGLLLLSAGCGQQPQLVEPPLVEWMAQISRGVTPAERVRAAQRVGDWPAGEVAGRVAALRQGLSDADWTVRRAAALGLAKLGPAALPAKVQLLQGLGDPAFDASLAMQQAVKALGPQVVPDLIALARGGDGSLREMAVSTLGGMAAEAGEQAGAAVQALLPLLGSPRLDVRWVALENLKHFVRAAPQAAQPALEAVAACAAGTTESLRVRVSALGVLAEFDRAKSLTGRGAQVYAAALQDANPAVRQAAQALRALAHQE
jgi:HEAT repeat protein